MLSGLICLTALLQITVFLQATAITTKGQLHQRTDKIVQKEILPTKIQARHLSHSHIALSKPTWSQKAGFESIFFAAAPGVPDHRFVEKHY